MIYVVKTEAGKVELATEADYKIAQCRHDWDTFEQAVEIAHGLTESTGTRYIATDSGNGGLPRYDVIKAPAIGDKVSYAFNGDYYPCGEISKISDSMRCITTTDGAKFYRRKMTGTWLKDRTWSMVHGHINRKNMEF